MNQKKDYKAMFMIKVCRSSMISSCLKFGFAVSSSEVKMKSTLMGPYEKGGIYISQVEVRSILETHI